MRFLIVATAFLLPSHSPAAAPQRVPQASAVAVAPAKICDRNEIRYSDTDERPALKTLDQLPAGNLTLAVQREVEGCNLPAIIRYDVGGSKAVQEPRTLPARNSDGGEPLLRPL